MASLRRNPKSRYWSACFTLPDGRQTQRSTKETDRDKALRIAIRFEDTARIAKAGRLTELQARQVVSDIYSLVNPSELPSSTTRSFLTIWLERKESEASKTTHSRYAVVVDQFVKFLGSKADRDLMHVTVQDFLNFRDALITRVSPSTINATLKILRSAFNQAQREGLVTVNEANKVPFLKREKFQRRPFTREELQKVLAAADQEWKGMILTGLYTGLRLGDVSKLRWGLNVDLEIGQINVQTGKTKRRVVLPIAQPLSSFYKQLKVVPELPLFPHACEIYGTERFNGALSKEFYRILEKVGLVGHRTHAKKEGERSTRHKPNALSFHCLRHTTTSLLKNAGVSDAIARDIVGHESVAVSDNYTHIDIEAKREAINRLPLLSVI